LKNTTSWICAALTAALLTPLAAHAEPVKVQIRAQRLVDALNALAEQSHLQLIYDGKLVADLSAPEVSGTMEPAAALDKLLAGTGLAYRFVNEKTVTLQKVPAQGARTLGPVRVEGATKTATAGVNGSTDITATEGSGSYTTNALTIGSKLAVSIRDTPQSVSVITNQQITDRNMTDLTSALRDATGVTLVNGGSVVTDYYSRGMRIGTFQIDGGGVLNYGYRQVSTVQDLAAYDHVELLRGADGLFAGAGYAGGIVNLTRKRPLDHQQTQFQFSAGTWDNYRVQADMTGPIALDGRVRARMVLMYEDKDFFYVGANNKKTVAYGVIEGDLTPTTVVRVGGNYEKLDALPVSAGVPRYANGDDVHLRRSTGFYAPWNRYDIETPELFAALDQKIGDRWSLQLTTTRWRQNSDTKTSYCCYGAVDAATFQTEPVGGGSAYFDEIDKFTVDATVTGAFDLFGHEQEVVVGATRVRNRDSGLSSNYASPSVTYDVFHFDPSLFSPEPATTIPTNGTAEWGERQKGLFGSLRLHVLDPLKLILGARNSSFEYRDKQFYVSQPDGTRYDYVTTFREGGVWTPYGGIVYDLNSAWSLYGSYTDIFSSQTIYLSAAGKPLDPLVGANYEVGAKAALRNGAVNVSLAAYRIDEHNGAVNDNSVPYYSLPGGLTCCFFGGATRQSQGADAEISGEVLPGLQLSAGYTYNTNKYVRGYDSNDGSAFMSRTPKHLLKVQSSYQLPGQLSAWSVGAGVNAQTTAYYAGSVCTEVIKVTGPDYSYSYCNTSVPYRFTQGLYAVANARVAWRPNTKWQAALNVNNLFNRTYYETAGDSAGGNWYGAPFNLMLSVNGTF